MIKNARNANFAPVSKLMILQSDPDLATPNQVAAESVAASRRTPAIYFALAFALFLAVVVGLQVLSGTYRAEFSAYPDEPAHYVTSLMVWDYVRHLHLISPMQFARDYYEHYPKVALGHWPPFFYFTQAAWMLLFTPSRIAVRLEIAATSAFLALALFAEIRKRFGGWRSGTLAGLLCVSLPLVQTYSSEEMAEAMLTLCCFYSVIFFARFIGSVRSRDAVVFAVFFSLAVLTKGNGWLLAMVPLVALLLTRKLQVMWTRAFWLAVLLVAVCCLPWQLMTIKLAERGWEGGTHPSAGYSMNALWEFLLLFPAILGPVLVVAMLAGIYRLIVKPLVANRIDARDACMCALLLSVWVFHSVVPAGVEDRKLIIAVPAMIYFIVPGAFELSRFLPSLDGNLRWRLPFVTTALAVCFFAQTFRIPHIDHYGFDKAAAFIAARPQVEKSNILVSSQSVGEGLLVSELAMIRPEPVATVIRATKALASVAWNGADYRCRYSTAGSLLAFLKQNSIGVVVVDTFPKSINFLHDRLLREVVKNPQAFELVGRFNSESQNVPGEIDIYRARF